MLWLGRAQPKGRAEPNRRGGQSPTEVQGGALPERVTRPSPFVCAKHKKHKKQGLGLCPSPFVCAKHKKHKKQGVQSTTASEAQPRHWEMESSVGDEKNVFSSYQHRPYAFV